GGSSQLLVDDLIAEVDALVADVDAGPCDQLLDLALALAAEAAEQLLVSVGYSGHVSPFSVSRIGRLPVRVHVIDDAVLLRFLRGQEVVPLHVLCPWGSKTRTRGPSPKEQRAGGHLQPPRHPTRRRRRSPLRRR